MDIHGSSRFFLQSHIYEIQLTTEQEVAGQHRPTDKGSKNFGSLARFLQASACCDSDENAMGNVNARKVGKWSYF